MTATTPQQYWKKIQALGKEKRYEEAHAVLNEALSLYPTNSFLLSNEIYLLYKMNRIKDARQKAEERMGSLQADPFFLATYLRVLDKEKAKEEIAQCIEKNLLYGDIKSEQLYESAAKLAARVLSTQTAFSILARGMILLPESTMLKALYDEWSEKGVPQKGTSQYAEPFKGMETKDAIAEIESIRKLSRYQKDSPLLEYLAQLYEKEKDYLKATEIYKYILTFRDVDYIRSKIGFAYKHAGDHESAIPYLREVFINDPFNYPVRSALIAIFKKRCDYDGFAKIIHEALAAKPDAKRLYGVLKGAEKWKKD